MRACPNTKMFSEMDSPPAENTCIEETHSGKPSATCEYPSTMQNGLEAERTYV